MTIADLPLCDGCGQPASAEHIARRLKRLEWTTRYRPVHIQTLLLGAASPEPDAAFLYAPEGEFSGEAEAMLRVAGVAVEGKSAEAVHAEFQRCGFFLTHVLECPLEPRGKAQASLPELLAKRAPAVAARIRRSLKPKRVVLISEKLAALVSQWTSEQLGCLLLLQEGKPYALDGASVEAAVVALREALAAAAAKHAPEGPFARP